jgi:hypothetical protein
MSLAFPTPSHLPCPDCGQALPAAEPSHDHVCDGERQIEFLLVELRDGIERVEADLADWLGTPDGRFAQWLARRR